MAARSEISGRFHRFAEGFRALVDALGIAVWEVDERYRIVAANHRARELFGDVVGDFCYRAVDGRSEICPGCPLPKIFEGASSARSQMERKDSRGNVIHVDQIATPIRGADDELSGALVFVTDITEQKQAEQALIRSERMAAIGKLASGVAHEFNNIHAVIIGYLELLVARDGLPPDVSERLRLIHTATERAAGVTRNLLAFSRKAKTVKRRTTLSSVVEDTVAIVSHEFATEGVQIESHLHEGLGVEVDSAQIQQVVLNLLMNARHAVFGRPEKRIFVRTGRDGGRTYFKVSDTGCGIAPENLGKIFAPFFSTKGEHADDPAQSSIRGTGLGLSVCKTIVENHEGEIAVDSVPEQGSTFTVWLPLAPEEAPADSKKPAGTGAFPGARVLVLDDEPAIRELLREFLEPAGYEVAETDDGHRALELVEGGEVDLAIVDLQMPKMSGEEFLEKVAALPGEKRPACLALTGRLTETGTASLSKLGVYDIIAKPFKGSTVRECTYAALKTSGRSLPGVKQEG